MQTSSLDSLMDPRSYRNALGSFATGATVVTTTRDTGEPMDLMANSFTSISLDPSLVLWSLSKKSPSLAAFEACSHYAINVLASEPSALSTRFATPNIDKFAGLDWQAGDEGVPLLGGAAMQLVCENHEPIQAGDHVMLLAHVTRYDTNQCDPVIFCRGSYLTGVYDETKRLRGYQTC